MDTVFSFPASPGTPLFPVSPERANRRQHLPQSPSLPSIVNHQDNPFLIAHARGESDVQGKVAQFNNLSKEAAQRRKDNEAALKRALLGREEAEAEAKRLKEENKVCRYAAEEGQSRERKVVARLEEVIEELQRAKETHAHSQTVYEKEVRRARKEAFKSSSALVKMQEELKTARNRYTLMREEADAQRRKFDAKEQETFAAQYQLVGLQEELDALKQRLKVVEEEREVLKTSLKEEEVSRIAAEGAIALPALRGDDEFASPKKSGRKHARESLESMKENIHPVGLSSEVEVHALTEELRMEKRRRLKADDEIHFMKMECQFRCCSCRIAEKKGVKYVGDDSLDLEMARITASIPPRKMHQQQETPSDQPITETIISQDIVQDTAPQELTQETRITRPAMDDTILQDTAQEQRIGDSPFDEEEPSTPTGTLVLDGQTTQQLISFSPTATTFYTAPSPIKPENPPLEQHLDECFGPSSPVTAPEGAKHDYFPTTPRPFPNHPSMRPVPPRTVSTTTTTTIPLKDNCVFSPAPNTPGAISREEALEQIRQRRGRARSIAAGHGTPRKPMAQMEGFTPRREISAPAVRGL